jgi:hypothetical protein
MKTLKNIIAIAILIIIASCSKNDEPVTPIPTPEQTTTDLNYFNGSLSTGATANNGTTAPTGYTWSEIEATNDFTGFIAANDFYLADDFIVPVGEKWTINKFVFFAYQTNYLGTNSPFNEVKYEIYDSNPSAAGASKIFGGFTINKYATSEDSKMYRLFNATADLKRKIYKITASATDLVLMPGTYWIKWQTKTITDSLHYHPSNTTKGTAGVATYNSMIQEAGIWKINYNGTGNKVDFPFGIVGTKTKI